MKNQNEKSKRIDKRIIITSLVYTLIFSIAIYILPTYSLLDQNHDISRILTNTLIFFPLVYFMMYLISGSQILIFGNIIKKSKNNLQKIFFPESWRDILLVISLSIIWFVINLLIWNFINRLKLG